jgi:hypothetical protein
MRFLFAVALVFGVVVVVLVGDLTSGVRRGAAQVFCRVADAIMIAGNTNIS